MSAQKTTDEQTSRFPFRVIIVGAGPTGLMAAHIFSQIKEKIRVAVDTVDFDFVILEARSQEEIVNPQHGAALVMFPHTLRIMDQLGLLDGLKRIAVEMDELRVCDDRGWEFYRVGLENWMRGIHGANPLAFHRPELLRYLYDSLPSDVQERIITDKTVTGIQIVPEEEGGGVVVTCRNGTIERGDIVIGADGVHSRVREAITKRRAAKATCNKPGEAEDTDEYPEDSPFVAEFRCLFGYTTHLLPGLEPKRIYEMHSVGKSSQVFAFDDKALFLIYQRLENHVSSDDSLAGNTTANDAPGAENPGETPEPERGTRRRKRYAKSDVEEFIRQMGEVPIAPQTNHTVRVKDLYDARRWAILSDLHEGISGSWHAGGAGRMVLVGDAVSKQTPNMGNGWNTGVQDVVVLANLIKSSLKNKHTTEEGRKERVTTEELEVLFREYHTTRYPASNACFESSANWARWHSWDGWLYWFADRYIQPFVTDYLWAVKIRPLLVGPGAPIAMGHVLDFLPEKTKLRGTIPWVHVSPVGDGNGEDEGQYEVGGG